MQDLSTKSHSEEIHTQTYNFRRPPSYWLDVLQKLKQNHDIAYYNEYPEEQCKENYIAETGRRISERIIDHAGRDYKSNGS